VRKKNISGTDADKYKGVYYVKPYKAQITYNGKTKYLGAYDTAEEAARVYDKAVKKYHKEYGILNFPED